jgi:hypothetical protein
MQKTRLIEQRAKLLEKQSRTKRTAAGQRFVALGRFVVAGVPC